MVTPNRNDKSPNGLRREVARSRQQLGRDVERFRDELAFPKKIRRPFQRQPGIWITGLAVAGVAVAAAQAAPSPAAMPTAGPTSAPITIGPTSIMLSTPGDQQFISIGAASSVVSQNPAVATASGSGGTFIIRAISAGTTSMTVMGQGWTRQITVTVMAAPTLLQRPH